MLGEIIGDFCNGKCICGTYAHVRANNNTLKCTQHSAAYIQTEESAQSMFRKEDRRKGELWPSQAGALCNSNILK
jgi:hypothetical protein